MRSGALGVGDSFTLSTVSTGRGAVPGVSLSPSCLSTASMIVIPSAPAPYECCARSPHEVEVARAFQPRRVDNRVGQVGAARHPVHIAGHSFSMVSLWQVTRICGTASVA